MSKVYLIQGIGGSTEGWDMYQGHVIVAESAESARMKAALKAADEGEEVWMSAKKSSVVLVADDTELQDGIILSDFNAG